jgi:hypothetical protein
MKVLVIYEQVPEEVKEYIVELSEEEWLFYSKFHGYHINGSDDAIIDDLIIEFEQRYLKEENLLKGKDISDVDKYLRCGILL